MALAACVAIGASPAGAAEAAAPQLLSAELADPAITGAPIPLSVRAAGRGAPVTGMVVDFGGADGAFGLSSCGILDSTAARGELRHQPAPTPLKLRP